MTGLIGHSWRNTLKELISSARRTVVIVAPYIKSDEAAWLCELLDSNADVVTLSSIQVDAVGAGSLDIEALLYLSKATPGSRLFHNEHLHAKVYIADDSAAIVTSGNLTQSGLDNNLEFGMLVDDAARVQEIRRYMMNYRQRSASVSPEKLEELLPIQHKLREEKALKDAVDNGSTQEEFNQLLLQALASQDEAAKAKRNSNAVFRESILKILAISEMATPEINDRVQAMHPELCDDSVPRYPDRKPNGSKWKSRVRHAQDTLKKQGRITRDPQSKLWSLVDQTQEP